ncbi:type I inositol-1,4,5-trisphosphate 5-phosphatase [Musa troglodytarum]|uniref:Type I inositol-1,4,5-trisphosphate 5-phosphatase n=1 Tax=Musa troglodytarum TaxID=320322 RepID=A0A9E7KE12_9LILI|nr:type I inositol-1,4,5-trisphosphate 5-phosphatase [Musa troglodytarum]
MARRNHSAPYSREKNLKTKCRKREMRLGVTTARSQMEKQAIVDHGRQRQGLGTNLDRHPTSQRRSSSNLPPSVTLLIYVPPFNALKQILPSLPRSSAAIMPEKEQQVEVLWPRLVANKLLRRPVGSNSFVADLPCSDVLLEPSNLDVLDPKRPQKHLKDTRKYKLYVSTWNVGGVLPSDDLNLEEWLDVNNDRYDIYVLGFQEIVPLNAKTVLGAEKRRILAQWNSLVRTTLNKSSSNLEGRKEAKVGEKHRVYPVKEGFARDFRCIISKQMVGVLVSVWARHELQYYIRHPSVSCVGCGVMGCLGNKGSVSVRFCLHETSFCFVCCHLASGGRKGDEMNRNSDAVDVLSRTSFPRGPSLDLPHNILDHDRVILLGDLNYRISLPEAMTRSLVEQKQWDILLERDQLRTEVSRGRVFEDWQEGAITFSPTYKYYPNSDKYYGCIQGQKGEKRRAPAWCDRILWHGDGLKQKRYDRCESRLSDHRPVRAVFTASVDVRRSFNSLGSFFLSERFDRPDDEHANGGGGGRRSINVDALRSSPRYDVL